MSKERLYNDTVVDLDRLPTDQLLHLYEEMETQADKLHVQMEKIMDIAMARQRAASPESSNDRDS